MFRVRLNSPWWLVGALGVFTGFVILSYYVVVAGWSLAYVYKVIVATGSPDINHAEILQESYSKHLGTDLLAGSVYDFNHRTRCRRRG